MDAEDFLRAPLMQPAPRAAAPASAGALSMVGLGLMLGGLLSLAWVLTGQIVWEIAGFGVGACVVGLIARARVAAGPVV